MTDEPIQCRLTVRHTDFILRNHRVHGVSVMPGVTFIDIILRILTARGLDTNQVVFCDLLFTEALATAEGIDREVTIKIGTTVDGAREISAASRPLREGRPEGEWRRHLTARLAYAKTPLESPALEIEKLKAAAHTIRDIAELYDQARQEHIVHGSPMQCRGRLYEGKDGLLAEVELDPSVQKHDHRFHIHPAKLDASTLIAFAQTPLLDAPFIPISLASVRVSRPLSGRCYVYVPRKEQLAPSGDVMHNDYLLYGAKGQLIAEFVRLTCKRIRFPGLITALIESNKSFEPSAEVPAVSSPPTTHQNVRADINEPASRLTDYLRGMVGRALNVEPDQVSTTEGFYEQGLDSVAMLGISQELELVVGSQLYPTLLFEFRNIDSLARHLTETYDSPVQPPPTHSAITTSAVSERRSELGVFRRIWHPRAANDTQSQQDLVLLTFADDLGSAVAESLRARGYEVATVSPILNFDISEASKRYYCDISNTTQLVRVLNTIAATGHELRTFAIVANYVTRQTIDAYAHDVFRALASALLARRSTDRVRICFVAAGGSGPVPPEYASVAALARTVSAETPLFSCRSIAVEDVISARDLATLLSREFATSGDETEVRYRSGRREVPEIESFLLDYGKPVPLRQQGVYLIAGGGGGLGRSLACYLAEHYKARLLLVGRNAPDAEFMKQMHAWREGDAQVEYLRADITNIGEVTAAVERAKLLYGELNGVFHLAGEIHDALFFRKDLEQTNAVIAPKLQGAVNLDLATRDEPLDIFVLFSSLSSVVANQGQSDYAYANSFLDHFAAWRKDQADRSGLTVAIGWPYWAEGGMRLELDHDAIERERSSTGLEPLPTKVALNALPSILGAGEPHVVVAYGDAARYQTLLSAGATVLTAPPPSRVDANAPTPAASTATDIAIIGFTGRYPQAPDIPTFWQNLVAGRDAITEIPADRWNHELFFNPSRGKRGKTYSRWGGFIDGVDRFAASFFSISRRDAERMDPQERLFLQAAWHALEDAGYLPEQLVGERVGVFAGVMWSHYQLVGVDDGVAPLALHSSVPNRVSYCFGFTGPSIAVDTACSSSLVALHLAVGSIRSGDSTMALVGGVNVTIHPQKYLQLAEDQFLSDDGRCRAFGSGGTGYVPGEGVGVLVIKPLARALADGDHIDAIIKGSSVNHSGRTSGYTVPDPVAQAELIREAIRRSGVPANSISYIEAHGTGTSLGDPIEIDGLRKAFADTRLPVGSCAIGSVKSNVGHLESAAGVAGVSKVLLQMRYRELVPSLHADELNSHIDFASSPFFVQRQRTPWRAPLEGEPLRAGVSAFGAGGTNAHVILEAPPASVFLRNHPSPEAPQLIVLSAPSMESLGKVARSFCDYLTPAVLRDDTLYEVLKKRGAELVGVSIEDVDAEAPLVDLGLDTAGLVAIGRVLVEQGKADNILPDPNMSIRDLAGAPAAGTSGLSLPLRDIAFTLQVGRRSLSARLALVVSDIDGLRVGLRLFLDEGHVGNAGYVGTISGEARPDPECVALFQAGKLREVARRWVKGATVDWVACHEASGTSGCLKRISLPGTSLPEERCWIGAWKNRDANAASPKHVSAAVSPVELQFLESGIAVLTMRDQTNRNMFTDEMLRSLEESFTKIASRSDIKVVVLAGTEQVFCMGGAPAALEALAAKRQTFTDAAFVYEGLLRCERPVIAAIQGHASGGGLAFGMYADVIVMSREGGYSANFLKYGFTPGMGASYILERRLGAALATEMLLTGRTYKGEELERRGAQILFEPAGQVLPRALNLARSIASMPTGALQALKKELARRTLKLLPEIIESELLMHDQVLGEEAVARVRQQLTASAREHHHPPAPAANRAAEGLDQQEVVNRIVKTVCAMLYVEAYELQRDTTFSDMGVDSIGAVEIVRDLNENFGTELDSVAVYDHPTVSQLAQHVLRVRAKQEALHTAVSSAAHERPGAPAQPPATTHEQTVTLIQPSASVPVQKQNETPARITLSPVTRSERQPVAAARSLESSPSRSGEIAVIGMSGCFPDAPDLNTFWKNLVGGVSSIGEIPLSRWDVSAVFDPEVSAEGKTYSRWAAMLTDVDRFDHRFFKLSPLEAQEMDPQQRLFLMEAWKALEDAGYAGPANDGHRFGVFVGCAPGDYTQLLEQAGRLDSGQAFLGNSGSILAARLAYFLDFHGPAVAVDTACSSSLVAVHLACQSLRSGDSDLALAGGVALMLTPSLQVRSSRVGMLSPTGTSAPFAANADGIVLGEGVGVVVLKRLADAIRDRDHICGVIKASGMNGDGKTNGITAPSASAQAALLRRVHAEAGIKPRDITFIEAHGTGTALGDPIEFKALVQAMGDQSNARNFCGLGSVKGNIGHTTMTAGVASLLKTLLSLRHRQLPPTPGFTQPNPKIDFVNSPFFMVQSLQDWKPGPSGRRISAVSSFGFSGTNCHVVVAELADRDWGEASESAARVELVPVSARTDSELDKQLRRLAEALTPQHRLGDIAFTLSLGRQHLAARAAIIANDVDDLREKLLAVASGSTVDGCWRNVIDGPTDIRIMDMNAGSVFADLRQWATAYTTGADLRWESRFREHPVGRVPLPTYPFVGSRHWVQPQTPNSTSLPKAETVIEDRVDGRMLDPAEPLVADHQVGGRHILAGAASVEFVVAAAQRRGYKLPIRLSRMRWLRPFNVDRRVMPDVTLIKDSNGLTYKIGDAAQPHSIGNIEKIGNEVEPERVDVAATRARCRQRQDMVQLYDSFAAAGLCYGPSFRLLRSVAVGQSEAVATLTTRTVSAPTVPAQLLDAAFQAVATLVDVNDATPLVPVGVRYLEVYAPLDTAIYAVIRRGSAYLYDLDITDATGLLLLRVKGLALSPADPLKGKVFKSVWREAAPALPVTNDRTVVIYRSPLKDFADALNRRIAANEIFMLPYDNGRELDLSFLLSYDTIYLLASAGAHAGSPQLDSSATVLFDVVKTLIAAGKQDQSLTIKVVVDGAVATTPDEPVRPHTASLIGLTRTIAAECPHWRVGCVDIGVANDLDDVARRVASEDASERLVALRNGRRFVRAFEPAVLPALNASPFKQRGVYLLLGGAGGIGFALSLHLAKTSQPRLAWIGRRPENEEIHRRIAAVAAVGGEVIYVQADATDLSQIAAAVAETRLRFGTINGAVHTAAVWQDRMLSNMRLFDLEQVLAAKVMTSVNLHEALASEPLDFIVFFSSAAALIDSVGQGNYAAASTFEDSYAAYLRRAGVPVTLVNWGYWGHVGAVADDYHRRLLAADGVNSLEPQLAFTALERALAARMEQVLVIDATPAGLEHFGINVSAAGKNIPQPDSISTVEEVREEIPDPISTPSPSPVNLSQVTAYVRSILAEVLRFQEHELDDYSTFEQFGVDSVISVSILARLERDLGSLPSTLLFEEMTIERLAKRLVADRGAELAKLLARATATSTSSSAVESVVTSEEIPAQPAGDVAVIGVVGRYPGAPDLDTFWRNLIGGVSAISEVPHNRWNWCRFAGSQQGSQSYHRWGGFIDNVDMFDASLFGILPRDAVNIDPQERLFLETCWSLLEQTGYLGLSHEPNTGVFVGLMYGTYGEMAAQLWRDGELAGAHSAYWSVANRVSYTFDLHGPSFAVDSACSSSLTAVYLACESIMRGDCRMAIAGGVNLILHAAHLAALGARNMLASDGVAKVFDARADGYVPGEGVGAILLKSLADAVADGDDIWAVIKGGALNAGGKTSGYTVPNPNAQANVVNTALKRARIDPRTISYVEAHGTGTELGDPIELAGLARAFRLNGEQPGHCAIGSVKSNIGHLEGAAGIAGLTKVLLQMRHRQLAPTINLNSLNPKIELRGTPFEPQLSLTEWPRPLLNLEDSNQTYPLRAGVSSFGAGGANVHLIVEEWTGKQIQDTPSEFRGRKHLVLLSAPTRKRLLDHAGAMAAFLSTAPDLSLIELAYITQVGRRAFDERLAVIANSINEVSDALRAASQEKDSPVVVVGTRSVGKGNLSRVDADIEFSVNQLLEQRDLHSLARMWTTGAVIDWRVMWPSPAPRRVALPPVPLNRKRYWLPAIDQPAETVEGINDLRYERAVWELASLKTESRSVRKALLVTEDEDLAGAVGQQLTERGIEHVFSREANSQTLIEQLAERGSLPDAVIHIGTDNFDTSVAGVENAFFTIFRLAVAVLAQRPKSGLRLLCARVEGKGEEQPHLVALAGLLKTLVQEHGSCNGTCVSLESDTSAALATRIVDELCCGVELDVSYRGGLRLTKKMLPFKPSTAATNYVFPDGTYIITGGAGALGLHFAGLLKNKGAGEIVLVGRSELDGRKAARIAAFRGETTTVRYERCDVTRQIEIESLFKRLRHTGRSIRGVIHAAGIINDVRALEKREEEIVAVLAPKVAGTVNLDRVSAADPLDFFVMFSSVVGQTGNHGQADYAYANAFLDAFAETRERWRAEGRRRGKSLSIGWPLWRDGGMRVDDATAAVLKRRWGMAPMRTELGLAAFESLLAGTESAALVIETVGQTTEAGKNLDQIPEFAAPAVDVHTTVSTKLCELAAQFLLVNADEVDINTSLLDIGFDSISMTQMLAQVNEIYRLDLLPTVLFEYPSLAELAEYIARRRNGASAEQPVVQTAASSHELSINVSTDIAVIGMAGILPGSANLKEFWRHLAAGDNLVRRVPDDRKDLLEDPRTRDIAGGFIDRVADFDAELFGIAPREAALMDPQQRLFLQTVWSAIADAGYKPSAFEGTQTGVFVGVSTSDYDDLLTRNGIPVEAHTATGISHAVLANRVSHTFGLRGPSEAIDTACSSSLVAVHRAVRALRSDECDLAIAGGVNVTLTPGLFIAFTESGMLSPDGRCKTFDKRADGYVRGEGAGTIILKRLDRALADGDHIHALIKGSAVNHGGRAASLTAPNPRAQAEVLSAAYADAGIDVSTVSYLEAHGTGTKLGDPIEIEGIKSIFGGAREGASVAVGSVKTNIGHLESAAGIAGLLKVLLALRHDQLPPHLHLKELNPHIRLEGTSLVINRRLRPWHPDPVRRAGVSSFGFGGTNAHVVVEAAPIFKQDHWTPAGPLVLVLSAPDAGRLAAYAEELAYRLDSDDNLDLHSVAYVLQTGREELSERLAIVGSDRTDFINKLRAFAQNQPSAKVYRGTASGATYTSRSDDNDTLASAWVGGASINWQSQWPQRPRRVSLPIFPFRKVRHWFTYPSPNAALIETKPKNSVTHTLPDVSSNGRKPADVVRTHLADLLHMAADNISADQPFQSLGLDSIFALDLAERLTESLGAEVLAATLYDHNTINTLIAFLGENGKNHSASPGHVSEEPASPAQAPASNIAAEKIVTNMLAEVLGHPLDLQRSFVENGFTSIDMLRAVSELERGLGSLPKTLLFDQPDLKSLVMHLCAIYGADAVAKLGSARNVNLPLTTGMTQTPRPVNFGPVIIAKRALKQKPSFAELVASLARQHGMESGLAGADIAPLIFLGSDSRCYFEFSQQREAALVWSYIGPAETYAKLVEEFVAYARIQNLRVNILSPTRIEEVSGVSFTATPFGVVQQIEDLENFSLNGSGMRKLRSLVNRFSKSGTCTVTEYTPGTNADIDQQIISLIDRWAAGKSTVNPYIYTVRESLSSGRLAAEHRVFLTNVDEILRAIVIVTRMQSEAGYLLDVEFYGDDMPLGGLEYTIVRIIEVLQAEGVRIFSFGATFGIKICDSPNNSTEAEQALQELRSVGVLGMGNYRFKKKFQPAEFAVYLCQPATEQTAISDILLMIARPNQVREAEANQSTTLAAVEWNPLRLPHSEIEIDLLTDSWAEREDPWICERMRLLAQPWANAPAMMDLIEQWWLPFTLTVPMPSGRAAEALLCRAWPGGRGTVLHNGLFPTLSFNLADQRFKPVAITTVDDRENGSSGDLYIPSLKEALAEKRGEVSLIAIELSVNAGGGRPISLANLKQVRVLADSFEVPLLLDATRIVENAVWISECEPDLDSRDPWIVIRELLALADVATFSLSKDFGVNFGGLVVSRIPALNERLKEQVKLRGMDVGLLSRRMLQRVLSDTTAVLEQVRERMAAARALWQQLLDAGLPVITPVGGHCVLLDVGRLPAFNGYSHPVAACLSWIYEHTGIRGGPHLSSGGAYTVFERCIRLAIPIGMTVEAAGQAGEKLAALFRHGDQPNALELITQSGRGPEEARYRVVNRVKDVVPVNQNGWFAQQLRELGTTLRSSSYIPADQNREVLLELAPTTERQMVTIPEGIVEVFSIGAGPVLLLLHPFNIGVGMFAYQLAELSDRFRIIVIHQPGVGMTRAEGSLSLEGIANLQRRVLSELGVNKAVHIGGASVGAIFAQYFALRFPEETLSLSLIGGSYRFANRKGQIDKLEQVIAEDFDMIIAGSGSARIAKERERLTRLLLRCESMDPHTGLRYLDLFAREPELTPRLGEIKVPTLVLQGRNDSVVGVKTGHFLHGAIPNARYVELPESGHFICFTDPHVVNCHLAAFLQEVHPGLVR